MFHVKDSTHIDAPIDRCFMLSTSIDLVAVTLCMKPVAGKLTGLILLGDRLTWKGKQFGLPQTHETLITGYKRPSSFQDTMVSGRFRVFRHDHEFAEVAGQTLLKDIVRFSMPFGWAGKLFGKYVMVPHIHRLIAQRYALLKRIAESDEWRQYVPDYVEPHDQSRPHLIKRGVGHESSRSA